MDAGFQVPPPLPPREVGRGRRAGGGGEGAEAQFQLWMTVQTVPPPVLAEAAGDAQASIVPDLTQLWPKDSGRTLHRDLPVADPVVSSLALQTPAGLCSHSASKFSLLRHLPSHRSFGMQPAAHSILGPLSFQSPSLCQSSRQGSSTTPEGAVCGSLDEV